MRIIWFTLFIYIVGCHSTIAQDELDYRRKGVKKRENIPVPTKPVKPNNTVTQINLVPDIQGRVIDAQSAEPLIGVIVKIPQVQSIHQTDYDGNFSFSGLAPGIYQLEFELISYERKILQNVLVRKGKATKIDITLNESILTTDAVVVEAELKAASDAAALSIQRSSIQVSDGMSGQMVLRETGDLYANVALRRMPGITLIEDKILFIRGLHERYNNMTFNGALLPSSEIDRSIFDFTVLPSNMVSGIRLVKSTTSDVIGALGGGYIEFQTTDLPQENSFRAWTQLSYQSLATFKEHHSIQTDKGLLGEVPNFLPENFPLATQYNKLPLDHPERLALARKTKPNIVPDVYTAPPGATFGLTVQRKFKLLSQEAGLTAYAGYTNDYRQFTQTYNIVDIYSPERGYSPINDTSTLDIANHRHVFTTMLNAGIKTGKRGKIAIRNLLGYYSDNAHTKKGEGFDIIAALDAYNDTLLPYLGLYQQFQKQLYYIGQIAGEFALNTKPNAPRIGIDINYSYLYSGLPSYLYSNFRLDSTETRWIWDYGYFSKSEIDYATIIQSQLYNHILGGNIYLDLPLTSKFRTRFGVFNSNQTRYYRSRYFTYLPANYNEETEEYNFTLPYEDILYSNLGTLYQPAHFKPGGISIYEKTTQYNNFNGYSHNIAPFVTVDFRVGNRFRFNVGARYEYFKRSIDLYVEGEEKPYLQYDWREVLPSATFMYNLSDKSLIRFAYFHTLSRPTERDAVPLEFLNFINGILSIGNPNLTYSRIKNSDLRFEFYPSGVELISASIFYKYFDKPIEQTLNSISGFNVQQYQLQNSNTAQVLGLEAELRLKLSTVWNTKFLQNLTVYSNIAFMRSVVNNSNIQSLFVDYGKERQLQGQANYTINAGLLFKEPKTGVEFALFYNRVGERIAVAGLGDTIFPSFYELPRDVVELQLGYGFAKNFHVRLQLVDILAQPFRWVQIYDGRKNYESNRDRLILNIQRGWNAFLTLSYRL